MRAVPPSEVVERWSTNKRHTRLHHGTDVETLYKKLRQMKRATPSIASSAESQYEELIQKTQQKQPIRFDDVLSKHMQAIESNRIIPLQNEAIIHQRHRQLFISDKPIVIKGVLSWKEAQKTDTAEEEEESKEGFARHAFNQYASDRLGYFRDIPDTRHTL